MPRTDEERRIDLCVKLLYHSCFDDYMDDRRMSEVKEALKLFFPDEVIKKSVDIVCGRAPATNVPG